MIGSSSARRVSKSWRTNSLRSSPTPTRTSGRCSATYDRLPRRSITPSDSRPWIASRTEVRATWNCSDRARSDGICEPGSRSPRRDAFEQPVADQRAERFPGDGLERRRPGSRIGASWTVMGDRIVALIADGWTAISA